MAPYAGAVVMLSFKTKNGRTVIARVHLADGSALPFGAEVFNAKGGSLGVVGQTGQILLRGVEQSGQVTARWQRDDGVAESCRFSYQLAPRPKGRRVTKTYEQIDATCVPSTTVAMNGKNA